MPSSPENAGVVTKARPFSRTGEVHHDPIARTGTTKPLIAEVNDAKDRALVHFVTHGMSGFFHGTCL